MVPNESPPGGCSALAVANVGPYPNTRTSVSFSIMVTPTFEHIRRESLLLEWVESTALWPLRGTATSEIGERVACSQLQDVLQLSFVAACCDRFRNVYRFPCVVCVESCDSVRVWGVTPTDPVTYLWRLERWPPLALLPLHPGAPPLKIDPVIALRLGDRVCAQRLRRGGVVEVIPLRLTTPPPVHFRRCASTPARTVHWVMDSNS